MTLVTFRKQTGLRDQIKRCTYTWVLLYRDQYPLLHPHILGAEEVQVGFGFFLRFSLLDPFNFCRRGNCRVSMNVIINTPFFIQTYISNSSNLPLNKAMSINECN